MNRGLGFLNDDAQLPSMCGVLFSLSFQAGTDLRNMLYSYNKIMMSGKSNYMLQAQNETLGPGHATH